MDKDTEEASEWYQKAMAQGHEEATEKFYSYNSKALEKAAKWYYEAILQGEDAAKENFYSFDSKQLEKFAKSGDAQAQYDTGNAYLRGSGFERDPEEASEWYMKAMAQNHAEATEKFYSFYSKALEKAAKKGDARAQFETGNAYLTGTTGKKDTETAAEWFMKAM